MRAVAPAVMAAFVAVLLQPGPADASPPRWACEVVVRVEGTSAYSLNTSGDRRGWFDPEMRRGLEAEVEVVQVRALPSSDYGSLEPACGLPIGATMLPVHDDDHATVRNLIGSCARGVFHLSGWGHRMLYTLSPASPGDCAP